MPIHNSDIAYCFQQHADLLEIDEANPFRIRAFRNAARTIAELPRPVQEMLKHGEDLTTLPGIGKDLAEKMGEIVKTGSFKALRQLKRKYSDDITDLLDLPGLGAKRVKLLYKELKIRNLKALKKAAESGKLTQLPGVGDKTVQKILEAIAKKSETPDGITLLDAEEQIAPLIEYLKGLKEAKNVTVAGSCRRCKETVGDADILVSSAKGKGVIDHFVQYEDVDEVVSKGTTRSTVILRTGLQVDLRVVPAASFGAALVYFTGSKPHNLAMRRIALKKGLKINEYGVFRKEKQIAGKTETEVYKSIGLPYIPPELREDRGEIDAAKEGKLPKLITLDDIKGDLHMHSQWTDGRATIKEMAEAAKKEGYRYIALTDHSRMMRMAHGLDAKHLRKQIAEIDKLNEELKGIQVLKGIEVDILEDGSLDLPDSVLKELDLCVCSIHTRFNLSKAKQTERIIRAMDNPYCRIIGHPTGRLIGRREPYDLDIEKVILAAKERGRILEVNAQMARLDLKDTFIRLAIDAGVKVAISTDAHSPQQLQNMWLGVATARRGWATAKDVINTRSLKALKTLLKT